MNRCVRSFNKPKQYRYVGTLSSKSNVDAGPGATTRSLIRKRKRPQGRFGQALFAPARMSPSTGPAATSKVVSALAYAGVSIGIMLVNKITMTGYKFPSSSFVGLSQMVFSCVTLFLLRCCGYVEFPMLSWDVCKKVNPLPLLFVANLVSGLGGTKAINLPMFTVLRRFSIVMTMAGQYFILGKPSSCKVQATVWIMVIGALIAASNDLAFDALGYAMILSNDFFTAASGIFIQKKTEAKELGKFGLIYYNALFSMPFLVLFMLRKPEDFTTVVAFEGWSDPKFCISYACSTSFGLLITYCIVWCTSVNSALTTTVIGCLKNLLVAYVGMFVGGDYIFSWLNFTGITVSVCGAICYSIVEFYRKSEEGQGQNSASTESTGEQELTNLIPSADKRRVSGADEDVEVASETDSESLNVSDEEAAFLVEEGPV